MAGSRRHSCSHSCSRTRRAALPSAWAASISLVVIGAAAGCADFPDPSTVVDLRVLAVAAEPSEIILNVGDAADFAGVSIPPIAMRPLIADPAGGGRPVVVTISACANDPGAPSPPNNGADPTGFPSGGVRTTVGSALCDGAPTEVILAADTAGSPDAAPIVVGLTPEWVMNAFLRDVFAGPDGQPHGGFDLGMPVVFQVTARAGDDVVRAIKRVTFWLNPIRDDQRANATPTIGSVRAYDRRDPVTAEPLPEAVRTLEDSDGPYVAASDVWIEPAAGDAEPFVTAVLDRVTGRPLPHDVARETLRYTFYATAGTFSPFETSSEPAPGVTVTSRVHIESKYKPPPASQRPTDVTMWIVVRDERGGVSFISRALHVPAAGEEL